MLLANLFENPFRFGYTPAVINPLNIFIEGIPLLLKSTSSVSLNPKKPTSAGFLFHT